MSPEEQRVKSMLERVQNGEFDVINPIAGIAAKTVPCDPLQRAFMKDKLHRRYREYILAQRNVMSFSELPSEERDRCMANIGEMYAFLCDVWEEKA